MAAPNPLFVPTTAATTIQIPGGSTSNLIELYITGTWGIGEDATINLPTTTGGLTPYFVELGGSLVALTVGNSNSSVTLPGGILFTIVKGGTAAAAGLDVQYKPRIGSH